MPFSTTLKALREERNLTQAELARLTHLTVSAISMYENGKREPKFEILEMLADFFNVNMDILLGRAASASLSSPARVFIQIENEAEEHLVVGYRRLDDRGKETIDRTMDMQLELTAKIDSAAEDVG